VTSTSRQSIATLATDLQDVLAWGESTESANSALREMLELERSTVLQQVATIAAKDAEIAEKDRVLALLYNEAAESNDHIKQLHAIIGDHKAEIARLTALLNPAPAFVWGDATRQQFLGAPFTEPFPFCYESEFYASGSEGPIDYGFVRVVTMRDWRAAYPNSPRWAADIEWQFSGGVTAAEVQQILPAFQAARDFAAAEGRGLKLGAYNMPKRIGVDSTATEVEVLRPILDLLDEVILPLYPLYTDVEKGRRYVQQNIAMARAAMPGKPVYVIGWPAWHPNAVTTTNGIVAGAPVSVEWWRMLLEESRANADGFAVWLKAATPKPTNEPWWLETLARAAA
jgi:hypothetical protein